MAGQASNCPCAVWSHRRLPCPRNTPPHSQSCQTEVPQSLGVQGYRDAWQPLRSHTGTARPKACTVHCYLRLSRVIWGPQGNQKHISSRMSEELRGYLPGKATPFFQNVKGLQWCFTALFCFLLGACDVYRVPITASGEGVSLPPYFPQSVDLTINLLSDFLIRHYYLNA